MKNLLFYIVFLSSTSIFSQEMMGYKIYGYEITKKADVKDLTLEFEKMKADENYEIEDTGLCVVYGDQVNVKFDDKLDSMLALHGYSINLESIYGSIGEHVFEVHESRTGLYIGSFGGVYRCLGI